MGVLGQADSDEPAWLFFLAVAVVPDQGLSRWPPWWM
jgi:hypothetical protein